MKTSYSGKYLPKYETFDMKPSYFWLLKKEKYIYFHLDKYETILNRFPFHLSLYSSNKAFASIWNRNLPEYPAFSTDGWSYNIGQSYLVKALLFPYEFSQKNIGCLQKKAIKYLWKPLLDFGKWPCIALIALHGIFWGMIFTDYHNSFIFKTVITFSIPSARLDTYMSL